MKAPLLGGLDIYQNLKERLLSSDCQQGFQGII